MQQRENRMTTIYTIADDRGIVDKTTDSERAGRLSRAGLKVNAVTFNRQTETENGGETWK